MKKNKIYILAVFISIITILVVFSVKGQAADYTVSTQSDLQEALHSAINGNVIEISQDISLTATLTVDKSLKFTGNNVKLMVDGDFRHFSITGSNLTVSFEGVELVGRKTAPDDMLNPGGGITSGAENLTLSGAVVKDCYQTKNGGGFYTTATANIVDCSFTGNSVDPNQDPTKSGIQAGGGLYTTKAITLNDTIISNNSAFDGGGIASNGNDASVSLIGCTITGNTAAGSGGTWPNYRGGAGVWTTGTKATVSAENTELSSNVSAGCGGGIMTCSGDAHVTLSDSTVSGNTAQKGGGVFVFQSTANVLSTNSTITKNTATTAIGGAILSFQNGTGEGIVTVNGGTVSENTAESNGGAVYGKAITFTNITINQNTSKTGNGGAVYYTGKLIINSCAMQDNTASLYGGAIYGSASSELDITKGTVSGNTSGVGGGGIFSGAVTTIDNSVVTQNKSGNHGAGVYATGTLTVKNNTLIHENTVIGPASGQGGGLWGAAINISDSTISNNTSLGAGGGIFCSTILDVTDSKITGNKSTKDHAGGISGAKITLTDTELSGNTTATQGGGLRGGDITITGGKVSDNSAGTGGGIYCTASGKILINNSEILLNNASIGGGIYAFTGSTVDIQNNALIYSNTVTTQGGGIWAAGTLNVTSGEISDNQAPLGGGVYASNAAVNIQQNGKILSNRAGGGGGVYTTGSSVVTINGGELSNNRATSGHGGAVCTSGSGGIVTMISGSVSYNEAAHATNGVGGAFATEQGNSAVTISGGQVFNNKASHSGGGIYSNSSAVTIKGTAQIMNNNATGAHGGAIYIYGAAPVYIQDDAVIENNTAALNGGAVHTAGANASINMSGGSVENNIAQMQHGGAFSTSGAGSGILVTGGRLAGNQSSQDGGAIFSNHALVDIQNTVITGNKAGKNGGAIHLNEKDATLTVMESTISDNEAKEGGAICAVRNYDPTGNTVVSITGSVMERNKSTAGSGGAVSTLGNYAIVSVSSSKLNANTAAHNGGAIYTGGSAGGAHVICTNTEITDNISDERGGGIFVSSGNFTLDGAQSVISGNTAKNSGGGVYIGGVTATAGIKQGKINGNKSMAGDGGGIYIPTLANLTVESDAQFSNNAAVKSYAWTLDPTGTSYFTSLHNQKIKTASFTTPFTNLYNNYDVNFSAYSIIYKANGSGEADIRVAYQKDEVAAVIPNPFHYTGKTFAFWDTAPDATGLAYNPGEAITIGTKDVVLYAVWDNILYDIRFDTRGGLPVPPIQVVYYGSLISMPTAPKLAGNHFTGWYKDEACTELWNFDTDAVVANMTLYAGWDKETYTVSFNSRGGSPVDSMNVPYGELIPVPADPILAGNVFAGWYKDEALNDLWHFDYDVVTQNITLYAKWIAEDKTIYTVTYKPNGAPGNEIVSAYEDNTIMVVLSNPFERGGYSFVTWNTSETGDGIDYDVGSEVLMHDHLVLYAQWSYTGDGSSNTANLTIECIDQDGKMIYTLTTTETAGANISVSAPLIAGYELNDSAEKTVLIQAGENKLVFVYKKIQVKPAPPTQPPEEPEPPESEMPNEKAPQTGVTDAFPYWIIAFSASLAAIVLLLLKRRRKQY